MQRLEVSGAIRPIYGSLGVKRLMERRLDLSFFDPYMVTINLTLLPVHNLRLNFIKFTIILQSRLRKLF